MSKVQKLLNEFARYPQDAYISSKRLVRLMADVLEECKPRQQISLYANSDAIYMKNNVTLKENEYLYLMRLARRANGVLDTDNPTVKRKRWTFCWQGSAIYFNENAKGEALSVNQPQEFVLPEVECHSHNQETDVVASGAILDVIKQLSIQQRNDTFFINNGMRTKKLVQGKPITAHFAIAVAKATGKHADKASHPDYCRQCNREVMQMARFKVSFSLANDEVLTIVSIE